MASSSLCFLPSYFLFLRSFSLQIRRLGIRYFFFCDVKAVYADLFTRNSIIFSDEFYSLNLVRNWPCSRSRSFSPSGELALSLKYGRLFLRLNLSKSPSESETLHYRNPSKRCLPLSRRVSIPLFVIVCSLTRIPILLCALYVSLFVFPIRPCFLLFRQQTIPSSRHWALAMKIRGKIKEKKKVFYLFYGKRTEISEVSAEALVSLCAAQFNILIRTNGKNILR